jgi:1,2-phenylacetyl-CoA epoxidase catalytic subunit
VRSAFAERAAAADLGTCYVMQDILLETFAVTLYEALIPASYPFAAERLHVIASEEREHLEHGIEALGAALATDAAQANARIDRANETIGRTLVGWISPGMCEPHCGVCHAKCAKLDLHLLDIDMARVEATFVDSYGHALREAGAKPVDVARWLARLPA